MSHRPNLSLVGWLLVVALPACTVKTEDNFPNPPPGPPASCMTVAAIDGCDRGSVSYSCAGDRPDDGDTNLVCSAGTPAPGGATLYCCAPYGQPYSDCTVSTSIPGCVASSFGFACSGAIAPDQADPSLACSKGAASGATTGYCCNSGATTPTCAPDPGVSECKGVAIGYSCVGPDGPAASDPSLACGPGTPSNPGVAGYCCIPFAKSAAACDEDDAVPGCGAGSFGFSCAGGATPGAANAALQCGAGMPGSGDVTRFCCSIAGGP